MKAKHIINFIENNFREVVTKRVGKKEYRELRLSKKKWIKLKKDLKKHFDTYGGWIK